MKYQIICTETKLSPVVQKNIIDKLEKVEKMLYRSEEFDCRIVVKFRNNKSKVEITIPTPYLLLRSEVENDELIDAVEIAKNKLLSQIRKVKARLDRSKNKVNLGKTFGDATVVEEKEEVIVKNKKVYPQPMSGEDAIIQMDSLDHDFFIFERIENQNISVLYKRKDGDYGVIDIE